jgi:hypothetical protein
MFYNSHGKRGTGERVPQTRFLQDDQIRGWNPPQPNACKYYPRAQVPQMPETKPHGLEAACFARFDVFCANSGDKADLNFGLELLGTQAQLAAPQFAGSDASSIGGGVRQWTQPDLSSQARARPDLSHPSRATQPLWTSDLPG